jgi:acetyl-CoA C-acetyltransferase
MNHNDSRRDPAREAVIVGAARTPIGRFMGSLSSMSAAALGAVAVREAVQRAGVDPASVYEVIMGQVVAAGAGQAPARHAALKGGLPDTVGASSVNKACGSGLKAAMMAVNAIVAGEGDAFVAGGMESMTQAPHLLMGAREGLRYGHQTMKDSVLQDGLWCGFQEWAMGNAAEFIARQFEISREELDDYAVRSHEKAAAATAGGHFREEIVPVEIKGRKGQVTLVERDESIRADFENGGYTLGTSREQLAKLPPAFDKEGQITAGNAPGLNDGAAALVIVSRAEAERQALTPLARIIGYTHAPVEPQWIFAAPARAIPRLLDRIGWTLDEVDLVELNEAFAAQVLANGAELRQGGYNWDWNKVNVNGGAIALGHPIGASGARVLITLLYALRRRNLQRGIASLCLGGGEAVAMAIEIEG